MVKQIDLGQSKGKGEGRLQPGRVGLAVLVLPVSITTFQAQFFHTRQCIHAEIQ